VKRQEFIFTLPMTMGEIRRKVAAFKELFEKEPKLTLSGYLTTDDGETVFAGCSQLPVTALGRSYIYATVDGRRTAIRPDSRKVMSSEPLLILEGDR
jgi:hypothetical protein